MTAIHQHQIMSAPKLERSIRRAPGVSARDEQRVVELDKSAVRKLRASLRPYPGRAVERLLRTGELQGIEKVMQVTRDAMRGLP